MGDFLAAIGVLGFIAALVMLAIRAVLKKGLEYKKLGILAAASVLLFCVGAVIASSSPEYQKSRETSKTSDWVKSTTERGSEITGLKTSKDKTPKENEDSTRDEDVVPNIETRTETETPAKPQEEIQPLEQPKETPSPKTDEIFKTESQELIGRTNGIVRTIKPFEEGSWLSVDVVVNDKWYQVDMEAKERFANAFSNLTVNMVERIYDTRPGVHFVDAFGKEVASPKMLGGYKIIE